MVRFGGGRRPRDTICGPEEEVGDLESYLVRLQDEVTDVRVRITELRAESRMPRRPAGTDGRAGTGPR
jgi:hypothetical protein